MTFLDTNILLYAISTDVADRAKALRSREILLQDDLCVSVQVLQEFYVQATRPTRSQPYSHADATAIIGHWLRFHVVALTVPVMQNALQLKERYQVSYWDAAILAAAASAGCTELLSEDLNSGQSYDKIHVTNPFAS